MGKDHIGLSEPLRTGVEYAGVYVVLKSVPLF